MNPVATVTVIGKDKTGVIARVTNFLFEMGANIEALEEQVTRGQFSMTLQATWTRSRFDQARVRSGLESLGNALAMEISMRLTDPKQRRRFAIMATREPHCLESLLHACRQHRINAQPALVVANRPELKSIAQRYRVPFLAIPWHDRTRAEARAIKTFEHEEIDFIVLARFMKILSPNFVWRFKNKVINIHPSLLPSFPGPQAYRQAYESGVKIVGVTAHFVTMHLDEGPIIAQDSFRIKPAMRLKDIAAAGQKLEASVLVKAVQLFLSRKLDVYWGKVREV